MLKILIVDDSKFMRMTIKKILEDSLEDSNNKVIGEAGNGREAIQKYKELKPEVVIMDITMPVMNGINAVKNIIEYDQNAKIIMCSAIGQRGFIIESLEIGAKDFIVKPFSKARVLTVLNKVSRQINNRL